MDAISPDGVEIVLPQDAWWRLWTRLDQLHASTSMRFDGRGAVPDHFRYMGIVYRPKQLTSTQRPEGS